MTFLSTLRFLCLGILALVTLPISASRGGEHGKEATAARFLEKAREGLSSGDRRALREDHDEALETSLAILDSRLDREGALTKARKMANPFYASLALGGIAGTMTSDAPEASMSLYGEALARAGAISSWTGTYPTSLMFLFQLIPSYPQKDQGAVLAESEKVFRAWPASDLQKEKCLLAFAQAAVTHDPECAARLLQDVALKSNHYWSTIEFLGGFMVGRSPEEALALAEQLDQADANWPNDETFLRAVLVAYANKDFGKAFARIREIKGTSREIALVNLAEEMLAAGKTREAGEVIGCLGSLSLELSWSKESLPKLKAKLAGDKKGVPPISVAGADWVDGFLRDPAAGRLQELVGMDSLSFRDKAQADAFITKALPLAEEIRDMGYPHHGSPRSTILGILALCAVQLGEMDRALELIERILIPELRVAYLLAAAEKVWPLPEPVSEWPIHFWRRTNIRIP